MSRDHNLQPAFKNKNLRYIAVSINDGLLSANDIGTQLNRGREAAKKAEAAKNAEKADTAKTKDEVTTETPSSGDHMTEETQDVPVDTVTQQTQDIEMVDVEPDPRCHQSQRSRLMALIGACW